jgi:hypothetical protein
MRRESAYQDIEFMDWMDQQNLEFRVSRSVVRKEEDEIANNPFCSMCFEPRNVFKRELMGRSWC